MVFPPELRCCSPGLDSSARASEKREIRTYAGILDFQLFSKEAGCRCSHGSRCLLEAVNVARDVDIRCLSRRPHATKHARMLVT